MGTPAEPVPVREFVAGWAMGKMTLRPIETAPRDDPARVLTVIEAGQEYEANWIDGMGWVEHNTFRRLSPTHWLDPRGSGRD